MRKVTISAPKKSVHTTEYSNLAGVDFSQEAANVDNKRSPYSLNMISDNGKNPVKRNGWETKVVLESPVHNLWITRLNGKEYILAHAGTKVYRIDTDTEGANYTATIMKSDVNSKKGCGFFFREADKDGFYILTGKEYLMFDGEAVVDVSENCYVPITIIARSPSGGGESYEDINLISGKMCERFTGDDSALIYQLSQADIVSVDKIESVQSDGSTVELVENTDYTVDTALGKVTFVEAKKTPIAGEDNIYITYTKEFKGYKEKVLGCTTFCTYGVGGHNRVFLTGNDSFPAYDFWSEIYKPSYFPDLNFAIIGAANTAVMGYLKIGKYVAIVKESTGQDTAIFLRSGSLDGGNNAVFQVEPGIVGIGAVSKNCFAVLNDDPLFLSERGIFAISPSNLSYDRVTRNRSWYIDPQLRNETNLANAVACTWNGCYLLGINGNVYILDGRKKTVGGTDNDYRYECYLWDNVPASCFATDFDNNLYFGTADGRVCKFKTESDGMHRFSDDGAAIRAVWTTPFTDDGRIQNFKTLQKKGCLVVLAPYNKSSCKVYFAVDGKQDKFVCSGNVDITDIFEEIDFERLTFISETGPREIYFNKKQRKYKRLQLVFVNDEINEGFGIFKIVKTFAVNGYSKNRR